MPRLIPPRGWVLRAIEPVLLPPSSADGHHAVDSNALPYSESASLAPPPPGLRTAGGRAPRRPPASRMTRPGRRNPQRKTTRATPGRSRTSTVVGRGRSTTSASTPTSRSPRSAPSRRLLIGNVASGSCSPWTGRGPFRCDGAVERRLLLPRAVFADGFGTANGQAVKEYFLLWDGERRGLVFRNARSALPKPNDKQKNRQSKWNEFLGLLC